MELIIFLCGRGVDILVCPRNDECFDGPPHDFVAGSVRDVRYKSPGDIEVLECCTVLR